MASAAGSTGSSRPGGQPKPPVIVPGTGNNIIVNPCQVRMVYPTSPSSLRLTARKSNSGIREEYRERVRGDTGGLPSGQNYRRPILEVRSVLPNHHALAIPIVDPRSLRYHRLHPEYIHQRIEKLGHAYNLRILLLMCDVVRTPFVPPEYCGVDAGIRANIKSQYVI